jgi:hypothetical protein
MKADVKVDQLWLGPRQEARTILTCSRLAIFLQPIPNALCHLLCFTDIPLLTSGIEYILRVFREVAMKITSSE